MKRKSYEEYKKSTKKWNCLAAVDTLAQIDFWTTIISLDRFSIQDLDLSLPRRREAFSVAIHEYTHFLDYTSTLWGLRGLKLMNDAYMADWKKYQGTEVDFFKAKKFYDFIKTLRLPKYYTVIEPGVENIRPWSYTMTVGRKFSGNGNITEDPIIFHRFLNAKGELMVRSPISMVSVLESSAMAQELFCERILLEGLDEQHKIVEENLFKNKVMKDMYDPDRTEYSIISHLISNSQNQKNVFSTFTICPIISRIVLNFPLEGFLKIKKINLLELIPHLNPEMASLLLRGLEAYDFAVLYYIFVSVLAISPNYTQEELMDSIKMTLQKLCINYEWLVQQSKIEAYNLLQDIQKTKIYSLSKIVNAGYKNYELIDWLNPFIDFSLLNLPPVWIEDTITNSLEPYSFFKYENNQLRDFNLDKCFEELSSGQSWVERFSEACI